MNGRLPRRAAFFLCIFTAMENLTIAIIGYGRMGRMIEATALERGHKIGSRIDLGDEHLMSPDHLQDQDIAIEFTGPDTAFRNITRCLDAGLPVVSGSTGWTRHLEEVRARCENEGLPFFYASNFSLGVNILFHINKRLARIMDRYPQYDVTLREVHHIRKLDAPSGTAISLAQDILDGMERKTRWTMEEAVGPDDLKIQPVREGDVPGIHEVRYESEFDELSLRHSARDRRGMALGAVMAAEYLIGKKGFHTMADLLQLNSD